MNSLNNGNLDDELEKLAHSINLILMFDFDGTLSPIVSRPDDAEIDKDIENTLLNFENLPNTEVWIVSGRCMSDLHRKVKFKNLIGSHGLECSFLNLPAETSGIANLEKRLRKDLKEYDGVQIELKKYSIGVHYRNVNDKDVAEIKEIVKKHCENFQTIEGKKVIELRMPGRNKGDACIELLRLKNQSESFYAGDDVTDEDAFLMLKDFSTTVKVGNGHTSAKYCLPSIKELNFMLNQLLEKRISHVADLKHKKQR